MSQNSHRIVLTYLNTGGRAEAIRLVFTIGGVPFEDRRISQAEFEANQTDHSRFPTEQLPVLDIGPKKYTQAMAILRYAGKLAGLYPFDPREALAIDEALDHIFEVYKTEPAFNKTAIITAAAAAARNSNSNNDSPLNNTNNNNNNNILNDFLVPSTRSRKNSPVPPIPPTGDSGENHHQQLGLGNRTNSGGIGSGGGGGAIGVTSNLNSPLLLAKAGSVPNLNETAANSFRGDVTEQIKLCFRRVCELINYDIYGSPYIASPRPSIADFAVFGLVRQIQRGMIPHVAPTFLEAKEFAPLYQLVDILEDYPGVKFFYQQNF